MEKHGSIKPGDTPDLDRDRACRPVPLCKTANPAGARRSADELDRQDLVGRAMTRKATSPSRDS